MDAHWSGIGVDTWERKQSLVKLHPHAREAESLFTFNPRLFIFNPRRAWHPELENDRIDIILFKAQWEKTVQEVL